MAVRPKILVVEDEESQAEVLEVLLRSNFYEVIIAYDGEAGVKRAKKESPDLILMDVMMPKLSGMAACKQLKEDPKTKDIPIIMLTVKNMMSDYEEGADAGADSYITKPYNSERLLQRIKRYLPDSIE